jgi:phage tail-like protein
MTSLLTDPIVNINFDVILDGAPMGAFTKCEGLGVEYEMKEIIEGGQLGAHIHLPGKMKYTNVKLTRPLDIFTIDLAVWFTTMMLNPLSRMPAQIIAQTSEGEPLRIWNLFDVFPVRWTGPSFDATSGGAVATETFELAHHGFF